MDDETKQNKTQAPPQAGAAEPAATGESADVSAPPDKDSAATAGSSRRRRPGSHVLLEVTIPKGWLVGVVVALVGLFVIIAVAFSVLNRISTCAQCHVIEKEVETYKQTAHYDAGVVCQDCHTKPGVFNYFVRNLQGVTHVVNYASDTYQKPLTSYVGANNCVRCHPKEEIERDLVVGQIRVNHTGLREEGYQCLTCHANISHPGTQLEVARMPQDTVMSVCARCHDGKRLPDTCATCHVSGLPAGYEKVAMTVQVTPSECAGCHTGKAFCSDCHKGLQMPHPQSWDRGHGKVVLARGKSICVSCHLKEKPKFCVDCHGVAMPHPSGWTAQHDNVAARDKQVCVQCHGKDSCARCHGLTMPHPAGFAQTHPSTYSASPGVCSKCHSSSFCTACHGISLPHASSFRLNHAGAVYSNGGVCVKCHGNGGSGARGCYGGECHSGSIGG
jgi:nitrate/TMAO reductase-like tetraheme cytochrome c subunit